MVKMMETVLYYNPGRPETMKHVAMMKSVLVRMGVRIKNIGPEQVLEKVGEPEPDRVSFRLYRRRSWY